MLTTTVKMFSILLFLLLSFSSINSSRVPDILSYYLNNRQYSSIAVCEEALGKFAGSSARFTACAVNYSRPIRMCEYCIDDYISASDDYSSLLTSEFNGTLCKVLLMDLDRVQIVYTAFDNMKHLWNKANCNRCFTWSNNNTIATLSNETSKFIDLFRNASDCINTRFVNDSNNTEQICKDCMDQYVELNDYYESLKGSETDNLCMDIVDSMNATRAIWSDVLRCCQLRRTPEMIFLLSTALISLTPAIFYLVAKFYCESSKYRVLGPTRYVTSFQSDPSTSCN